MRIDGGIFPDQRLPGEAVKVALKHNAVAVIPSHNHPSGLAEPSRADEPLTGALARLALVDIKPGSFVVGATRRSALRAGRCSGGRATVSAIKFRMLVNRPCRAVAAAVAGIARAALLALSTQAVIRR
jgi:hypothetical protein